jgi:hypothetical protein
MITIGWVLFIFGIFCFVLKVFESWIHRNDDGYWEGYRNQIPVYLIYLLLGVMFIWVVDWDKILWIKG